MSRRQQMEIRVHEILDAGAHEDLFVEFKSALPDDFRKAARRIAGLANAARGTEVVWIVGVDDNGVVVDGVSFELSSWWPQVQKCFDEVAPDLEELIVARPEGSVLGLFFRTDRAPYVWKTEGSPEFEVSWRDGTRTRAARRIELLRILAPISRTPSIEVIDGSASFGPSSSYVNIQPPL